MASRFNRSNTFYMTYVFSLVLFCSGGAALGQTPDCNELKTRLERAEKRLNDWPALGRYREDNKKTPTPPKNEQRVVFIGDSITDSWDDANFGGFFPGKPYINRGISGQTTPQMLIRFRRDVIELKPKVVVILAGTNDIAGNTGPTTLEAIQDNLSSMAELATAHGIRVIFASVLPVSDYKSRDGRTIVQTVRRPPAQIVALNSWIKDYAAAHQHVYLDYFSALVDDKGFLKHELTYDGLHPNTQGYVVMAPLAESAIAASLKQAARSINSPTPVGSITTSKIDSKTKRRLDNVITLSHSASPEIQADLLLTIASSNLVPDKKRRIELLNEAFQAALRVEEPVRKKSWGLLVDTRAGFKQRAFDLQLDRLSIQSRAISAVAPLDPALAREMFQSVVPAKIQPLDCKDSLVPDFTSYYVMVVAIAESCFTPDEIKAQGHIQFLTDQVEAVKTVPQASAALKAVAGARLSDEEFSRVVLSLAKAFGQASNDPRSFAFALQRDGLISAATKFLSMLKKRGIPADSLSTKIRDLLVQNLAGEVCADAGWVKQQDSVLPPGIDSINVHFKSPITSEDLRQLRFGGKSVDVEYWTTAKGRSLLQAAKALRFAADAHQFSVEERKTEEWHQKLLAFLDQLDSWDAANESSEDDYFQQRCNMYRVLVDLCPDDPQRDAVLRAYGAYLKDSNRRYKGRIEWISPVKDYLKVVQTKQQKMIEASLEPWLSSSDNMLRVYAELSVLLKTK